MLRLRRSTSLRDAITILLRTQVTYVPLLASDTPLVPRVHLRSNARAYRADGYKQGVTTGHPATNHMQPPLTYRCGA